MKYFHFRQSPNFNLILYISTFRRKKMYDFLSFLWKHRFYLYRIGCAIPRLRYNYVTKRRVENVWKEFLNQKKLKILYTGCNVIAPNVIAPLFLGWTWRDNVSKVESSPNYTEVVRHKYDLDLFWDCRYRRTKIILLIHHQVQIWHITAPT